MSDENEVNYSLEIKKEFEKGELLKKRLLQASSMGMNQQVITQIQQALNEANIRLEELQVLQSYGNDRGDGTSIIIGE